MTMSDHFRRAARFDTLELEERLHRADVEGRAARASGTRCMAVAY